MLITTRDCGERIEKLLMSECDWAGDQQHEQILACAAAAKSPADEQERSDRIVEAWGIYVDALLDVHESLIDGVPLAHDATQVLAEVCAQLPAVRPRRRFLRHLDRAVKQQQAAASQGRG